MTNAPPPAPPDSAPSTARLRCADCDRQTAECGPLCSADDSDMHADLVCSDCIDNRADNHAEVITYPGCKLTTDAWTCAETTDYGHLCADCQRSYEGPDY